MSRFVPVIVMRLPRAFASRLGVGPSTKDSESAAATAGAKAPAKGVQKATPGTKADGPARAPTPPPPSPTEWELIPETVPRIDAVVRQCRRLVKQRALLAAGVAAVPIPGLDWAADIAVLMRLIPSINRAFGLTPEQVERLAPDRRLVVYKALSAAGGMLVGRLVTRELVVSMLKLVGVRLSARQAARFVPIAGQAVSAVLTYSSLKFVAEQHIQQCVKVSHQIILSTSITKQTK